MIVDVSWLPDVRLAKMSPGFPRWKFVAVKPLSVSSRLTEDSMHSPLVSFDKLLLRADILRRVRYCSSADSHH